jgi:Fe2+ or Zn2+ uptake regulation protein
MIINYQPSQKFMKEAKTIFRLECGKIIEEMDPGIEKIQERLAKKAQILRRQT